MKLEFTFKLPDIKTGQCLHLALKVNHLNKMKRSSNTRSNVKVMESNVHYSLFS